MTDLTPEPQWVIVKATFAPTGQVEPVARFGEPMVLPDVRDMLTEMGWLDPAAAEQLRAERDRYHEHSVTLNSVGYVLAEALAETKGEEQYVGNPLEQAQRLVAAYNALLPVAEAAKAWRDDTTPEYDQDEPLSLALIAAVDEWQRTQTEAGDG